MDKGPQYLEDLATAYWSSEALFTAVELGIFALLETDGKAEGKTAGEIAGMLFAGAEASPAVAGGVERFLNALCALGLLSCDGDKYYNAKIASKYLIPGQEAYQGDSILWRKYLVDSWRKLADCLKAGGRVDFPSSEEDPKERAGRIRGYISAMDRVARTKVGEILPLFEGCVLQGDILDVGAGSGAVAAGFVEHFPDLRATLLDLAEVLDYTRELLSARGLADKMDYRPANILEAWPVEKESFDLVILSNIIHAYAEDEVAGVLQKAAEALKPDGVLIIHDFFHEHNPPKAGLFDLNMFINTYNGKVFSQKWVRDRLSSLKLFSKEMIPLPSDTALILASKNKSKYFGLVEKQL